MAKKTIIKKWAEDTHNKYELSEEQVKTGIVRLGNIVSNQLNAVANRADTMIDLLQRCSAWNADKTYQQGDLCMVSVYYKRPSDAQHKYYIMFLLSTINDNTEIPLINNGAVSFTRNDDLTTPRFTITANSEVILSNFVNGTGWVFADSTCGDLTNCVNLSVSDLAHFKGNTSFDGNVVANSNINLAGDLTTQGHLELAGTANFNNSVTLNGLVNTATTPALNATGNEIVTAKWVRDFLTNDDALKYPEYSYIATVDFTLENLVEKTIEVKIPNEVLYYTSGFMFIIYAVVGNDVNTTCYFSSMGMVDKDVWFVNKQGYQHYPNLILDNNNWNVTSNYTGAMLKNGKWDDFQYKIDIIRRVYDSKDNKLPLDVSFVIGNFSNNTEYRTNNYQIHFMCCV